MASYFSEHYQPTRASNVTSRSTGHRASAAVSHGRVRSKLSSFIFTPATSDLLYLFKLRSSDVPLAFYISNHDFGTDVPGTIGLYKESDGSTVDADFFIADVVLETARLVPTAITIATLVTDADEADPGAAIWQILGLTEDPMLTYDVILTVGTVNTGNVGGATFRCDYLAGD